MGYKEDLKALKEEGKKLPALEQQYKDANEAIQPALIQLEKEYESKFDALQKAYNEERRKLNQTWKEQKEEISAEAINALEEFYNEAKNICSLRTSILNKYKIDNQLMCKLLQSVTNLHWKIFSITGTMSDPMYGGTCYRYGVGLVDETHYLYKEDVVPLGPYDDLDPNDHILISVHEGSSDAQKARDFNPDNCDKNWMMSYLLAKGLLPDNFEAFGFDHNFRKQPYHKLIIKAIDKYLEDPTLFTQAKAPKDGLNR